MSLDPYWAGLSLRDDDAVIDLRDRLWDRFDEPAGYDKVEPHVTIHPGFSVPPEGANEVASILSHTIGVPARVGPLQYWPSPDEPMVVKLSVESPLGMFRDAIEYQIDQTGGTIDREPVPLHVTLFKSGDQGEQPAGLIERPLNELAQAAADSGTLETQISGFHMEARL